MQVYSEKLGIKLKCIEASFVSLFKVYGIRYESKRDLPKAIRELMDLTVYNKEGGVKYQLPGK